MIAAAAEGDELTLVWSSGDWASYDPHAEDPGAPVRALRLGGGGRGGVEKAGGKRGARRAAGRRNRGALRTPRRRRSAAGTSLARARGAARASPCSTRDTEACAHRNADAAGGQGASVAALADADDGSFAPRCVPPTRSRRGLPARPPVPLAAALGALSAAERGAPARAGARERRRRRCAAARGRRDAGARGTSRVRG